LSEVNIILGNESNYYTQGNGQAESSNKNIIKIIKKTLVDNKKVWDSQLKFTLWVDRISTERSIRKEPFQLVYGIEVILPVHLELSVMKLLQDTAAEPNQMKRRIN